MEYKYFFVLRWFKGTYFFEFLIVRILLVCIDIFFFWIIKVYVYIVVFLKILFIICFFWYKKNFILDEINISNVIFFYFVLISKKLCVLLLCYVIIYDDNDFIVKSFRLLFIMYIINN